jgi:hypothetical protein
LKPTAGSLVIKFHRHALEGVHGFLVGDFDKLQNDGLIGTEHHPHGDPEEQGISNLTGGPGDGDANG